MNGRFFNEHDDASLIVNAPKSMVNTKITIQLHNLQSDNTIQIKHTISGETDEISFVINQPGNYTISATDKNGTDVSHIISVQSTQENSNSDNSGIVLL